MRATRGPFAATVPAIGVSATYLAAVIVWAIGGDVLPGTRWLTVHLFTLGVVTNLIVAFTGHFGQAVTRTNIELPSGNLALLNVGILTTLVGITNHVDALTGVGTTVVTTGVVRSYVALRRMRKQAIGARFDWTVRLYERAHGAFIHGAVLGMLLGLAFLPGRWFLPLRLAHLHSNVLGWGGLTVATTLVFFGPTMLRTKIRPGSEERAVRALRLAATGLSAGVILLVATAIQGTAADVLRWLAGAGFVAFAAGISIVCWPVAATVPKAPRSGSRWHVLGVTLWLPMLAWIDALMIVTQSYRWLDPLGAALLIGVLGQAILATLLHIAPTSLGTTPAARKRITAATATGAGLRTLAYNAGTLWVCWLAYR